MSPGDSRVWNEAVPIQNAVESVSGLNWDAYVSFIVLGCYEDIPEFQEVDYYVRSVMMDFFELVELDEEVTDKVPPDWVEVDTFYPRKYRLRADKDLSALYRVRSNIRKSVFGP
jgi:hypothetical protein